MRKYEGMYIIRPTLNEDQIKDLIEQINNIFLSRNAQDLTVNEWGMRDLAYEIDDFRRGYYVVFNVVASVEAVDEFNRVANIREDILRHIIIKD